MRKTFLMLIMGISVLSVNAQKESGIVYSEHEAIGKTKAMWAALLKGDTETYLSFYADTLFEIINGKQNMRLNKDLAQDIGMAKAFSNLSVVDDSPASPDAIDYKGGGFLVQDWLRMKRTHNETGINLNLMIHNLYAFNKNGKIYSIHQYFDNSVFDEIGRSSRTTENGKIYINHPYILTVRKLVNAYCSEDLDSLRKFYASNAVFTDMSRKMGTSLNLEQALNGSKKTFDDLSNITFEQVGYPDCIYYAREDNYTVYSWWSMSFTNKEGKKYSGIPVMLSHTFDKNGKVVGQSLFRDTNLLK